MYKLEEAVKALLDNTPIKQIARQQKIAKNTVKKYRNQLKDLQERNPLLGEDLDTIMQEFRLMRKNERYSENHGWLETHKEEVDKLSAQCDNYIRLNQVLREKGFEGSYSSLLRYVAKNAACKDRPVFRIESSPGELAQVDFGSVGLIYDTYSGKEVKAYVFVMVLGFSRDAYFEIVTNQNIQTWCNCHVHAFEHFGGVPRLIIPDNLKSAIIKAAFCDPLPNRSYADCAKHYGFQIDPCLPGVPEHKGKVESGVKYVKNNFFPLREFKNITDANAQLQEWNRSIARIRIHGTTRRKPLELFREYEQEELLKLQTERFEISVWKTPKVGRDLHIQFDKAYYSVPHTLRGERVDVRKTSSQIAVFSDNMLVAVHVPVAPGKRQTNKDHYPPDMGIYMEWDTAYCLQQASTIGSMAHRVVEVLLNEEVIRNLRSAQNIIRLQKKYGDIRLEAACNRAVYFGNYTYGSIKSILEHELEDHQDLISEETKTLSPGYARSISEIVQKEAAGGSLCTN
ncbi:MAG: IS21 family transposase [Bacteroidetes bacterium]|nr:IS21 family transposase [Bacteroidota bacterium]